MNTGRTTIPTIEDLKEFLLIQLLIEFDRLGRDLVSLDSWDEYSSLWFDALLCDIGRVDKINDSTDVLLPLLLADRGEENESDNQLEDGSLKDCPFCGSDDVFYIEMIKDCAFEISCGGCQIDFSCGDSTKERIAELWNRRNEK